MAWTERLSRWMLLSVCLAGASVAPAQAGTEGSGQVAHEINRTFVGQELFVPQGQQIGNAICIFCSVQIEGDVSGRVVVLFGNVSVTGRIGGNVAVLDGNAVLDEQARVGGNVLVLLGNAVYESDDVISGSAYVLGGHASSFATRERAHRRMSLTPNAVIVLVLLGGGLLLWLSIEESRHRRSRGVR